MTTWFNVVQLLLSGGNLPTPRRSFNVAGALSNRCAQQTLGYPWGLEGPSATSFRSLRVCRESLEETNSPTMWGTMEGSGGGAGGLALMFGQDAVKRVNQRTKSGGFAGATHYVTDA